MELTNPKVIREIMNKSGLKFNKALGQNFLTDGEVLRKIIEGAELSSEMLVIEIGPGIGSLTAALAGVAGKVVAVEMDKKLVGVLKKSFAVYDNVEIVESDIMKYDLKGLIAREGRPAAVVANLPYYITTPIIMRLLEEELDIKSITVMVQKEVADRIVAEPTGKEYGALTVAVQYYSVPEIICNVPSTAFIPPPKVDSAVVHMKVRAEKEVTIDKKKLFKVVKAAFSQRRKTLLNALYGSNEFGSKEEIRSALEKCGLDEKIRGERLSIAQFAALSEILIV